MTNKPLTQNEKRLTHSNLLTQVHALVRERMSGQSAGHGIDHVLRVQRIAKQLQQSEGGDLLTIELAALLHDIGDAKFHDGVERSGEFAIEILRSFDLPDDLVQHVAKICDQISFRKAVSVSELSLEARIVQDADRLEALGAIGIVRTIEYGATRGQPFFDADEPSATSGVKHFYDKLFRLRERLNTATAKQLAMKRESFMQTFLEQYFEELGSSNPFEAQLKSNSF